MEQYNSFEIVFVRENGSSPDTLSNCRFSLSESVHAPFEALLVSSIQVMKIQLEEAVV